MLRAAARVPDAQPGAPKPQQRMRLPDRLWASWRITSLISEASGFATHDSGFKRSRDLRVQLAEDARSERLGLAAGGPNGLGLLGTAWGALAWLHRLVSAKSDRDVGPGKLQ